MLSNAGVTVSTATQNQGTNCPSFPSSTSWSLHFNSNPISYSLVFMGLWKLVSKPLCPSSLWDRTAKVLRGTDLKDLSVAMCLLFFFFSAFAFLLVWHSWQRKGPSRLTCLTPNSMITPVLGTFEKPRALRNVNPLQRVASWWFLYLLLKETGLNKVKTKNPCTFGNCI